MRPLLGVRVPAPVQAVAHAPLQLGEGEVLLQLGKHAVGKIAAQAELPEFPLKQTLLESGVRGGGRGGDETRRGVHRHASLAIHLDGAKHDRGKVALAGGAQAEHELKAAFGRARLVGMRNDGGIEQRGRLQRILLRQVGSDEQLLALVDRLVADQFVADLVEALEQKLPQPLVPLHEGIHHQPRLPLGGFGIERHHAGDDPDQTFPPRQFEGTKKHPRAVGAQHRTGSSDMEGGHGGSGG